VRGQHEVGPRGGAGALAEHVAGPVQPDVAQPERLEARLHRGSARRLPERRGGDRGDLGLVLHDARLTPAGSVEGGLYRGVGKQGRDDVARLAIGLGHAERGQAERDQEGGQRQHAPRFARAQRKGPVGHRRVLPMSWTNVSPMSLD
jgi:hypothetical protein